MFEYLKILWEQWGCEHNWEYSYTETEVRTGIVIYHYVCLNCGKHKTSYRPIH